MNSKGQKSFRNSINPIQISKHFIIYSHLLNNLDVGRFGTTYTILNANDGTVIVPTTNQLSDLYTQWTLATHNMRMY